MSQKIAVATVSGKAYYLLVNELKQRKLSFLSCLPQKPISPSVQVVITTANERHLVDHPNVLVFDPESDPSDVVTRALQVIQNKTAYKEVTVGIDPGKNFGVAVLGDGKVIKKMQILSLEKTVDTVLMELKKTPSQTKHVKIGNGIPELAEEIAARLDLSLPRDVSIEIVSEAGTSTLRGDGFRKKVTDADSATEIGRKNGTMKPRRN
ncbi:MAG: hypothetical protein QXI71_00575 [Candidatus Bathyarchaeia archaeon]|nr:hypothetical protein [Candidatus Bathyarchaeota archaeon]